MPRVDGARLLADLDAMRRFGQVGTGVDRTALSEPDIAARRWLCGRLEQAGLTAAMDRHGTVLGRSSGSRALLIGSHTDSVPRGGWLDGTLGVACGLEVARALGGGVDVVSFQDEEGTFLPCLGSRAFIGDVTPEEIAAARSRDGTSLTAALAAERESLQAERSAWESQRDRRQAELTEELQEFERRRSELEEERRALRATQAKADGDLQELAGRLEQVRVEQQASAAAWRTVTNGRGAGCCGVAAGRWRALRGCAMQWAEPEVRGRFSPVRLPCRAR